MTTAKEILNYYCPQQDGTLKSPTELLNIEGTIWGALLYGPIYVPETTVVNGVVFLRSWHEQDQGLFVKNREDLLSRISGLPKEVREERLSDYNWIEIKLAIGGDWFPARSSQRMVRDCYRLLARNLVGAWDAILHRRYPERFFEVRILEELETGGSLGVGFKEVSKAVAP